MLGKFGSYDYNGLIDEPSIIMEGDFDYGQEDACGTLLPLSEPAERSVHSIDCHA